ncbi:MAG: hypothetical protein US57_C0011G0016 [Candidatus Moranbacteria bacterium GW2011_GWC2_37_73]|nr:MAG: hypothetical protein UR95_C0006G0162 [Parcubacteria group bacterium GW2011_GWC1_36_108]KKQ00361.1 MAG: hypothetical protein US09_C0013G0005 [Candidatus Moranbacteria bacterium GW2011_GWD1_36_198]KKQ01118.1 MAG: hypothetical protein US10_C0022G0014 [Candidatus Moranbacteria bacterium GW2011_GWD2_36_198]KKQ39528.1 MAG: hypothetical protein US57_C0011G0016 [Candidatus Moranbacteria bacterium GW2011_GWC2_37_73]HAR99738.1 hypothetical protein [Candidatus Moranbacteria bacterium]
MCLQPVRHPNSSDLPKKLITNFEVDEQYRERAEKINAMPEGELKNFRIKCLEVETGRRFHHKRSMKAGFNMYTALQCSIDVEKGAAMTLPESLRTN